jgi:arsenate reductase
MSARRPINVLFLCTGNSARSILAESLLRHAGGGRFESFSAGSHPARSVNPFALERLALDRLPTENLRSKPWDEFARPGAPKIDFVITLCDNAAGAICPVWPGRPISAHWGIPDPAAVEGSESRKRKAFADACQILTKRIWLLTGLPLDRLDRLETQARLREIGTVNWRDGTVWSHLSAGPRIARR